MQSLEATGDRVPSASRDGSAWATAGGNWVAGAVMGCGRSYFAGARASPSPSRQAVGRRAGLAHNVATAEDTAGAVWHTASSRHMLDPMLGGRW